MRSRILLAILLLLPLLALPAASAGGALIEGYTETIRVLKFKKVLKKAAGVNVTALPPSLQKQYRKYVALVEIEISFKISGYEGEVLEVPLVASFVTSKKYYYAEDPKLLAASVKVADEELAASAELTKRGDLRIVRIELKRPLKGEDAAVYVRVRGMIKCGATVYVTKEYKITKDFKPVSKTTFYYTLTNLWPYTMKAPVRVIIKAPEGYLLFYARTTLTNKARYAEIEFNSTTAVATYLSTSTMKPTSLKPGCSFTVEAGFIKKNRKSATIGMALILIAAAFFAYGYRDVYRYVKREVSVVARAKEGKK